MNLEEAQQKIRLYRKINEQFRSYRYKDYNDFYEFYPNEELESVQHILSEYEGIKFKDIINPENEFFSMYGTNYLDKYLISRTETCFKIHFEFSDSLFYELLNYFKEDVKRFIKLLPEKFFLYGINSTKYDIPYNVYQEFFTQLNDGAIKEAIKFLNRTVTSCIVSDYDHISTIININCINNYLNYSKKYNY